MFGLKEDYCTLDVNEEYYTLEDYESVVARWCPGCGDHAILTSIQKLCREKQLPPEKTVFVSGIGCSSRFPHYMKTYGFHGLHGRAMPVAEGVKFRRPDLNVFVVTGDGDCCAIGAGHWVHAVRYNMNITVMMFDNEIYGLTKKQTSPTSPLGTISNTHPRGSVLPPINPIQTTLGIVNASFVAQTADWNPGHIYATLKAAYEHQGLSFVRIIQRCPAFMKSQYEPVIADPDALTLLEHEDGICLEEDVKRTFKKVVTHDPANINKARELADDNNQTYVGLFYRNEKCSRYDEYGAHNLGFSVDDKIKSLNTIFDKFAV